MADLLEGFGGSGKGVGLYRLVSGITLTLLTGFIILTGWFVRDELQTIRDTALAEGKTIENHIASDVQIRDSNSQAVYSLDGRVTRIEQSREDLSHQIASQQAERSAQMQSLEQTLISVQRELSQIEGKLEPRNAR